jgi:transposase
MAKPLTITQFFRQFPDDETCLVHLFETRFGQGFTCPSCERPANWYRIKAERAYSCQWCGHHLHPTVGTPFEQTRTPLQLWFYAIHLFTTTRNGVAAKELERQLGVTYKTAWRMAGLIREHMANVDGTDRVGGHFHTVECDETLVGGAKGTGRDYYRHKTIVMGMLQRGGDVSTHIIKDAKKRTLHSYILKYVRPGSTINTDEAYGYRGIDEYGFRHVTVNHRAGEYARIDGAGVNGMESFWVAAKADDQRHSHSRERQAPLEICQGSGVPLQSSSHSGGDVSGFDFDLPAIEASVASKASRSAWGCSSRSAIKRSSFPRCRASRSVIILASSVDSEPDIGNNLHLGKARVLDDCRHLCASVGRDCHTTR